MKLTSNDLLKIRSKQPLLSSLEVRAQVNRHKAARLAAQNGSGSSGSSSTMQQGRNA